MYIGTKDELHNAQPEEPVICIILSVKEEEHKTGNGAAKEWNCQW